MKTLHFIRNQQVKTKDVPNLCLSDFIAPLPYKDYIGLFAVTTGIGLEKWEAYYKSKNDDYSYILFKLLADRLAEAFAELLHFRLRTEYWAYSPDEKFQIEQILKNNYRGIRPAPGYPACPDHSEKLIIFDLLDVENNIGISLTENYSMYPASSVSGYYFSHPASRYFNIEKISNDQVKSYAQRKQITENDVEIYLPSNINF